MRRAQLSLATKPLVGIILAVMLISFTFFFMAKLYGIFLSEDEDSGTIKRVEALAEEIRSMVGEGTKFESGRVPYYIGEGYVLVGFDSEWVDSKEVLLCERDDKSVFNMGGLAGRPFLAEEKSVEKPINLGSDAAICIYEHEKYDRPVVCERIEGVDNIYSTGEAAGVSEHYNYGLGKSAVYDENVKDFYPSDYEYLALYGECAGVEYGVRPLYVEIFEEDGEVSLFVSPYFESISQREEYFSKLFSERGQEEIARLVGELKKCYEEECVDRELNITVDGIKSNEIISYMESNFVSPEANVRWGSAVRWNLGESDSSYDYFMTYRPAGYLGSTYAYVRVSQQVS